VKGNHIFRDLSDFIAISKSNKIAVVDIETTDLFPDKGLIVEIGIVELDLDSGATKILFESKIKETGFMMHSKNSWIFNNSTLKYEDILRAPDLIDIKESIQRILNQYCLTAYNKPFDFSFLKSRGFLIKKELPDIMEAAKTVCKIIKQNGEYKNPNFQEAWDYFFPESNYIEKHRALDDALHEAMVLFKMYQMGNFNITFY
jgi:DNA polymerase-3 subunit epsilon